MQRIKSPVVWGVVFSLLLTQTQQLATKEKINGWDIAISCLTVIVSLLGALNNPTDKNNF